MIGSERGGAVLEGALFTTVLHQAQRSVAVGMMTTSLLIPTNPMLKTENHTKNLVNSQGMDVH